jgi:hypothetical protein
MREESAWGSIRVYIMAIRKDSKIREKEGPERKTPTIKRKKERNQKSKDDEGRNACLSCSLSLV